jgi:hypothetical protein
LSRYRASSSATGAAEPPLALEDARYLDKVLGDVLFDPTGAERVTGSFPYRSSWGDGTQVRDGWLVRGTSPAGNRVYFAGGETEPAPHELTSTNFVAACRARYAPRPAKESGEEAEARRARSAGVNGEHDLVLAAWLHKLGHEDLAGQALAAARADAAGYTRYWPRPEARGVLRFHLAESLHHDFVEAYATFRDEAALAAGTKLFALYRDVIRHDVKGNFWQAESILADLQRRKAAGALAEGDSRLGPGDLPAAGPERIATLIAALEDINVHRTTHRSFNERSLGTDWRVQMLVAIGDPAVPALIGAFEKDNRRTRSTGYPSVREPILVALRAILRVHPVEELSGRELLGYPAGRGAKLIRGAARLRAYWDTFGKFPFDERMMKVLTDPKSTGSACREAMSNLVALNDAPGGWLSELFDTPLTAKFSKPTVADAILAARERYLRAVERGEEEKAQWRSWRSIPCPYLNALVQLGDQRIAPALVKLAGEATDHETRLVLARAAQQLGRSQPMRALAREIETGTFKLRAPAAGAPRALWLDDRLDDLALVVQELIETGTEFTDRALWALADPQHPLHRTAVALLVRYSSERVSNHSVFQHPYWIVVARAGLADTTPTGRVYKFEDEQMMYEENGNTYRFGLPDELDRPELRRARVAERVCDRLALRLSRVIAGAPEFHPLRTDSEAQFSAVAEFVSRYGRRFRVLGHREADWLRSRNDRICCAPDIRPLNRAATVADIGSGDAVFHLNGKGEPAVTELPVWVMLKDGTVGLAVQAEIGPDGTMVYGVIFRRGMDMVPAEDVERAIPMGRR